MFLNKKFQNLILIKKISNQQSHYLWDAQQIKQKVLCNFGIIYQVKVQFYTVIHEKNILDNHLNQMLLNQRFRKGKKIFYQKFQRK